MAIPAWLTVTAWIFISLGLASAAAIVADIYLLGYREHMKIMEAVWPLTALYAGPAGLAAYFCWGRPMSHRWTQARNNRMPGKPFWAGTAVSTTHCGAGCVLGDVIAEWIVFAAALQLLGTGPAGRVPPRLRAGNQLGDLVPVPRHRANAPAPARRRTQARGQGRLPRAQRIRGRAIRLDGDLPSSCCSPPPASRPIRPRSGS